MLGIKCPGCNHPVNSESSFCVHCGRQLLERGSGYIPLSAFATRQMPEFPTAGLLVLPLLIVVVILLVAVSLNFEDVGGLLFLSLAVGGITIAVLMRKFSSSQAKVRRRNRIDFEASRDIEFKLKNLVSAPATFGVGSSSGPVFENLSLGEISRHFDRQILGSIEGWLDHRLNIVGSGLALQIGRVGFGIGRGGIAGQSEVNLNLMATSRDDLLGDGFVAVFEQGMPHGVVDTVRVVVPSEPAAREYVGLFTIASSMRFDQGSHIDSVFKRYASVLQQSLRTDVSYVADRLNAILRMPTENRPSVSVMGAEITEHAIIGSVIQIGGEERIYQLFPVGLLQRVAEISAGDDTPHAHPGLLDQ